jgi:hypothetical protein
VIDGDEDRLPPDPWRPEGHPFAVALDEAAELCRLVESIETVEGVVAAVFALTEAEARMIVLERALREVVTRPRPSA